MGGLMSWESAKRELESLYKNPEKQLSSINNDSSSYILAYTCTYMEQTRKQFEKPVKYEARYRVLNLTENYGLDTDGNKTFSDDYDFWSRSDALKVLRQHLWTQHKMFGQTMSIDDFSVDSIGWYKEVNQ
tara:strand:+ start:1975 stop:2364 length:390 start_codon:yes stop_codon:yes gene_type:complete